MRNEANFGRGRGRFGILDGGEGCRSFGFGFGAEESLELLVSGEPGALSGLVMAADALERGGRLVVGEVDGGERGLALRNGMAEHLGFDAEVAAAEPFGVHESLDEILLLGSLRTEMAVVGTGKVRQFFGVLAGYDEAKGVNAVAESVPAGGRASVHGARTGGPDRVQAIGGELSGCCHI